MTSTPQISTPEAISETMVAPGQEALLDEFIAEQQQAEEQERLLGKFTSTEELAKAYQELEKKLGQSPADPASSSADSPTQGYTAEQAVEIYGQEAVNTLAEKGVDLAGLMWQADQGQDISGHYDDLAAAFNVPRQVVENYVSKAQLPQSADGGLSDSDVSELKGLVGGEEQFNQLSQWAAANLGADELASYNAVVDGGNKDAVRWALIAMQARASGGTAPSEPKLISGGKPPTVARFESKQQVLDAMNKTNERGQRLYDVDDAYRQKFISLLSNSDVF